MFKTAVVPSGRVTEEGETIYKAAPTKADVKREVSAARKQTYGSGGKKISDTQRVEVTVAGKKKWVSPEKALAISKDEAKVMEARTKIKRREKLAATIKGRLEREVKAEVEEEPTVRKLAVTLRKEPTPEEVAKRPFIFPAILAIKEKIKEEKTKKAILEHPELFPSLFGLQRETFVGRKATKITIEKTPFGPRETFEEAVVGPPKKVTKFTPTGLLTLPQVKTLTKEERFKRKAEEKFTASEFGKGLREVTGQFGVAGATLIAKPVVEAAIVPLPKKAKEEVREFLPKKETVRITAEEYVTKGAGVVAYKLSPKHGLAGTALTIGSFAAGVGLLGVAAKGTRLAKPIATAVKYAPSIFVGALGAGRIVSGGFRVAAGEEPLIAIGKEAGTFGGELLAYGAVAKGLQLGVVGARRIIPRKFTPVKLVGARERILVGKGGQAERAFEVETALGRPFKARKAPKIKPTRLGFKESAIGIVKTKGGVTQLIGGERLGIAEVSFPKGVVPKKGVLPKVSIKKITGLTIKDPILLIGKEPSLGKAVFPKTPTRQELIGVKGFERLQVRPTELIEVIKPKGVTLYHAGDIPPSAKLVSGKKVYAFSTKELAEGWKIKFGKKSIYEITPSKAVMDVKQYARPIPSAEKITGYKMVISTKPEYIVTGIKQPKVIKYPFVTSKEVQVAPSIRKGGLIRQTVFQAQTIKGLEPVGFKETQFFLPQPKPRLEKPPKITIEKPTTTKGTVDKIIDLTSGKKREFARIGITKKKFDIGELKFKDVTKSRFIEVGQELPKARQIALGRIAKSTQQITKTISVSAKKVSKPKKPTVSVIETPLRARLALGQLGKKLVFVPPPEQVFKGQRLPTAGILMRREEVFEPGVIPISKIKPITGVARIPRQISQSIVVPDIEQIRKPTVDIIEEQAQDVRRITDVVSITEGITEFPRPPPPPPKPFVPGRGFLFSGAFLFLGEPIRRKKHPLRPEFGFTPGFMSAVLDEFGPPPRPGQLFTGQERRRIIRGKPFLTPLPKKREGIVQLVARQLGG